MLGFGGAGDWSPRSSDRVAPSGLEASWAVNELTSVPRVNPATTRCAGPLPSGCHLRRANCHAGADELLRELEPGLCASPACATAVCYRATRTGQEAWWMTLPATLPSTTPASRDLPLLPMTIRSAPILAAASAVACPSWPSGPPGSRSWPGDRVPSVGSPIPPWTLRPQASTPAPKCWLRCRPVLECGPRGRRFGTYGQWLRPVLPPFWTPRTHRAPRRPYRTSNAPQSNAAWNASNPTSPVPDQPPGC
jgi:hypothetical protein